MLEIAIVEDEEKEALRLGNFLDRYAEETGIELHHSWSNSAAAFLESYQCQYDLVFMDIRMPGIDGMAAAEKLREMDSAVVLISSPAWPSTRCGAIPWTRWITSSSLWATGPSP